MSASSAYETDWPTDGARWLPPSGVETQSLRLAVQSLGMVVDLDPDNDLAYRYLTEAYYTSGALPAAIVAADHLSHLRPNDSSATRMLGDLFAFGGDWESATRYWQAAGLIVDLVNRERWFVEPAVHLEAENLLPGHVTDTLTHRQVRDGVAVMALYTYDYVGGPLYFPEHGQYRVTVRAQNTRPAPVDLTVALDDIRYTTLRFDTGDDSWSEASATIQTGPGLRRLRLWFSNDYADSSLDRNAYIDWIEVRKEE